MSDAQASVWGPLWERIARLGRETTELANDLIEVRDRKSFDLLYDLTVLPMQEKRDLFDRIEQEALH
jgi:hypothetical protein